MQIFSNSVIFMGNRSSFALVMVLIILGLSFQSTLFYALL